MNPKLNYKGMEELFPTPLWIYDIEDQNVCLELEKISLDLRVAGTGKEWVGNWYSEDTIHELPSMQLFSNLILDVTSNILDFLKLKRDSHYISNMWFNATKPDHRFGRHLHPNCLLSGIFYVKAPTGCASTNFFDPRPAAEMFEPNYTETTRYNLRNRWIDSVQGRLVIFPAWLQHGVDDGFSQEDYSQDRVVLAFNINMRGEIVTKTSKLKLV